jgi:hypothetical protein
MENMIEFNGVTIFDTRFFDTLKQQALLFDKFYVYGLDSIDYLEIPENHKADALFLREKGILNELPQDVWNAVCDDAHKSSLYPILVKQLSTGGTLDLEIDHDYWSRFAATALCRMRSIEATPICYFDFPPEFQPHQANISEHRTESTLRLALNSLPLPSNDSPWEDVLNFKKDMRDKQWDLHRFLRDLSTKTQSEVEIKDDIEWTLNEYRKAMHLHKLKFAQSAIEVYLIAPLEILLNLITLKWSQIATAVLSPGKREIEMLEAESKLPGRECGYIFHAQERFALKDK